MNESELNKKLAEWAGFEYEEVPVIGTNNFIYVYIDPLGRNHTREPKFTHSLDACFKWLVPKIPNKYSLSYIRFDQNAELGWLCNIRGFGYEERVFYYPPALALCLAIEKLIDSKKEK